MGTTEGVRAQSTTYNIQISYKRNSSESHLQERRNHNESLTAPPLSWSRISISSFPHRGPRWRQLRPRPLNTSLHLWPPTARNYPQLAQRRADWNQEQRRRDWV